MPRSKSLATSNALLRRALCLFFAATLFAAMPAQANLNLEISEVGNDLVFQLQGSLDTSVFAIGPSNASTGGFGLFSYFNNGISPTGTVVGTSITDGSVFGDNYLFADDMAFTPIGNFPGNGAFPSNAFFGLTSNPLFWFSFTDHTPSPGVAGSFDDTITLPNGYVSGTTITLSHTEPNATFADLNLVPGEFWGVSFTDGMGGTQSVSFSTVPEPGPGLLALLALPLLFVVRRGRTAQL